MKDLPNERKKLEQVLKTIKEILINEKDQLSKLYTDFIGTRDELWSVAAQKKLHISNLEISLDRPYFARIDFTSDDNGEKNTIYIGKNGIMKDSDIVVTDWRAPISSLYYDAEIGRCSFQAPTGRIYGEMSLKRQYDIQNGELIDYFDVDLVSNDNLLQRYLNNNNDARLKSIVSTIQREQNAVIRTPLSDNLIVQGVAGSGKTTVALHRIAYLVYNYLNSIKQSQYLVIGPNPVFLKYIKSVLPELDVSGVEQYTFEEFAKQYINEEISINPSDKKANDSIAGTKKDDIDKFKSSMYFKNMLDEFMKLYFQSITINDLMIGDFVVLESSIIKEVFDSTENPYSISLANRIEMTINRLSNLIETDYDNISSRYSEYAFNLFNETPKEEREKMRKKIAKEREEISKSCRSTLRKYFSKAKASPTKLFKVFITTINDFDSYGYKNLSDLKKSTLKGIKSGLYDFEDLAALMYIKKYISPDRDFEKYRHVVIDEAQDLGEFNFYVLKNVLPKSTFSIFGDLAQSIYDYRGISNWESVNQIMFDNAGQIINFTKSYRTTAEIMDVADDIASSIGLSKSDLVVRHGSPVSYSSVEDSKDLPNLIMQKVSNYRSKGYKTIAIISKTNYLSSHINQCLASIGLSIPNVSMRDDLSDERFNICTISNQLAKGLEFDAVIITDASEENYSSQNQLDMKLLYVGVTRALHEIDIISVGELTKPLSENLKKNNNENVKMVLKQ